MDFQPTGLKQSIKKVISAYIKLFLLKYFYLTVLTDKEHEEFILRLADRLKQERSIWFEVLGEVGFSLRTEMPPPHDITYGELKRGARDYILEFGELAVAYRTDRFRPLGEKEITKILLRRMMNQLTMEEEKNDCF